MKWIVAFLLVLAGALAAPAQESRITAVVTYRSLPASLRSTMSESPVPNHESAAVPEMGTQGPHPTVHTANALVLGPDSSQSR